MSPLYKSAVYGALNGLTTLFTVVTSIFAGSIGPHNLLVMACVVLLADALTMAISDWFSVHSELQFAEAERKRERWECDNYLEGEIREMVELYMEKGLSEPDATRVVELLAKDLDVFVEFMMIEELGILPEVEEKHAWKSGM